MACKIAQFPGNANFFVKKNVGVFPYKGRKYVYAIKILNCAEISLPTYLIMLIIIIKISVFLLSGWQR